MFYLAVRRQKNVEVFLDQPIDSPRESWVFEIEKRLRKNGFSIKRTASRNVAIERESDRKTTVYNEASTRYILKLSGDYHFSLGRCIGGGYYFNYINAELIDTRKNETVMYYSNDGLSENCPPLSGTIFSDIEKMITDAWE